MKSQAARAAFHEVKTAEDSRPWTDFIPIVIVLILAQFVSSAGLPTIYVMLNKLYREYPTHPEIVGWTVTSYLLTTAITGAICGRLGDLVGRRNTALVVLFIAGAGSLLSAVSPGLGLLLAGTTLQGVAASLTPLLIGIGNEYLPRRLVPTVVGTITGAGIVGAGVVYLVAGEVVDHFASHGGFLFKTLLSIFAIIAMWRIVPPSKQPRQSLAQIDILRGVLFGPAAAGLLLFIQFAPKWGWVDPKTLCLFFGTVALLAYWIRHQANAARPLIDIRLLAKGELLRANIVMFLLGLGGVNLGQMISLVLQQPRPVGGYGLTAAAAGALLLPITAIAVLFSPLSGRLAQRYSARFSALLGGVAIFLAWTFFALWHAKFHPFLGAAALSSIGFSIIFPAGFLLMIEAAPADAVSGATGLGYTLFQLGFAVGSQILFALMHASTLVDAQGVVYPSALGLSLAFGYVAIITLPMLLVLSSIRPPARAFD